MKKSIMLASMHSGAGKTSLTFGILKYLKDREYKIRAFKTGPDFIDPIYHSLISGSPCINIDPYFLEEDNKILDLYKYYMKDYQLAIIEAAMGYYNGIYGFEPRASAMSVASSLNSKVCLIIDEFEVEKISEFIYRYDDIYKNQIEAVIFNRIKQEDYYIFKEKFEKHFKERIKVLGFIEDKEEFKISSRKMGLELLESSDLDLLASKLSQEIDKNIDMSFFIDEIEKNFIIEDDIDIVLENRNLYRKDLNLKIAIAKDEAFPFFYEDNLELLKNIGFEISYFSPLRSESLDDDISAIYIGAGYIETYAKELSENIKIKEVLREKISEKIPLIATGAGFAYLHKSINIDNKVYPLLAYFDASAKSIDKLKNFGYIEVDIEKDNILLKKGDKFRTHEFHYLDSNLQELTCISEKANKSKSWNSHFINDHIFAGFPYLYFRSNFNSLKNLKESCRKYILEKKLKYILSNINNVDKSIKSLSKNKWDNIGKPIDGLGELENIITDIAAIYEKVDFELDKKIIVSMCADNGIVEEGVSQAPKEVTKIVSENFAKGKASVNILANYSGSEVLAVDIGIDADIKIKNLLNKKISYGTKSFLKEAAMTKEEVLEAIFVGIDLVKELKEKGYKILGTGEMGIGNTTTSSALASILLNKSPKKLVGRGAGLDDEKLAKKIYVIDEAINKRYKEDMSVLGILANFGGLDISALVGLFIGAGYYKIPIVMDGIITNIAAYIAYCLNFKVGDYIIASHKSKEPASEYILEKMNKKAVLDASFCLGEGSGAALLLPLIDMSLKVYNNNATFEEIKVENYERFKR